MEFDLFSMVLTVNTDIFSESIIYTFAANKFEYVIWNKCEREVEKAFICRSLINDNAKNEGVNLVTVDILSAIYISHTTVFCVCKLLVFGSNCSRSL